MSGNAKLMKMLEAMELAEKEFNEEKDALMERRAQLVEELMNFNSVAPDYGIPQIVTFREDPEDVSDEMDFVDKATAKDSITSEAGWQQIRSRTYIIKSETKATIKSELKFRRV